MAEKLKITFGICTYNRKKIVENSAASLKNIIGIGDVNILICDDCSTEYDEVFLKSIFPDNARIIKQNVNTGADKNTSLMYEEFLKSNDEWLFNADSDLIYRSDIIETIKYYKDKSSGIVTFFNSITHNTIGDNEYFLEKDSIGAAGCLLHRNIVKLILKNIQYRDFGFDVGFSKLLRKKGYKLFSTKESYVQHIGVSGFNSRDIVFDYGHNFHCDSVRTGQIIENTFESYIQSIKKFKETKAWRVFYFIHSIPRRVRKILWMIKKRITSSENRP